MTKNENTKTITKFYLNVDDTDVYFRNKELALKIGKALKMTNISVRFMEKCLLWDVTPGIPEKLISIQVFDKTDLLTEE